jgi:hypothetical protein
VLLYRLPHTLDLAVRMHPFTFAGEEEQFHSLKKEMHKNTWGSSIPPKVVYSQFPYEWKAFATTFPHQAFLLHQLKSLYDNLDVTLRILADKQKEPEHHDVFLRRYDDPPERGDFDFAFMDPFAYFQADRVDYAHRKAFIDLFISLATDRKSSRRGITWREFGRSILENSYGAERASLVKELTSAISSEELEAANGPSTESAAIWRIRRQILVHESAMQKALARLRELLEEDKKKVTKRSVDFERPFRARSPARAIRRNRSWERSPDRSSERERIIDLDDLLPIREKRRSRSPSQSDADSVVDIEIIDEHNE